MTAKELRIEIEEWFSTLWGMAIMVLATLLFFGWINIDAQVGYDIKQWHCLLAFMAGGVFVYGNPKQFFTAVGNKALHWIEKKLNANTK